MNGKVYFFKLFILLLGTLTADKSDGLKCDLELMNSFKLVGMPTASQDQLAICTAVQSNCCTVIDELAIVKYWREFSTPKIVKFSSYLGVIYRKIFMFQKYISLVDFDNVLVHFTRRKFIPYNETVCTMVEGDKPNDDFDVDDEYKKFHMKLEADALKEETQKQIRIYENIDTNPRFLRKLTKEQKRAVRNAGILKQKLKGTIKRAYRRFGDLLDQQKKEIKQLSRKLAVDFSTNVARKYETELESFLNHSRSNQLDNESMNEAQEREFGEKAHAFVSEIPRQLVERAKRLKRFMRKAARHLRSIGEIKSSIIKVKKQIKLLKDQMMSEAISTIVQKKVPTSKVLKIPKIERKLPEFDPLATSTVSCHKDERKLFKNMILVNPVKFEFCHNVFQNIKVISQMDLEYLAFGIKEQAEKVLGLKKTLYCSVCDASTQKFFNHDKNVLMVSEEFCKDMLHTYFDYINFNNIVFIEYAEQLLHYISCLNTLPSETMFPLKTRLDFHKRNIVFFKRCFDNLENEDMMRHCHFICSTFNFNGFSKYIDGDLSTLYLVYLEILDFARNNGIPFQTTLTISKDFLQSLDHSFYPIPAEAPKKVKTQTPRILAQKRKKVKKQKALFKHTKANSYTGGLELDDEPAHILKVRNNISPENYTPPVAKFDDVILTSYVPPKPKSDSLKSTGVVQIFDRVEKVVAIQNLKVLFFEDEQGLNPIQIYPTTYFELDTEDYIRKHFKQTNSKDLIQRETLKSFFYFKPHEIHGFNSDIFTNVDPLIEPNQATNYALATQTQSLPTGDPSELSVEMPTYRPRESPEANVMF
jgi:hypothetical protein